MGNKPVYRYPPRSHAYSCRCDRCLPFKGRSSGGGWGIVVPFFIAAIIFIWPFAVWHGCKYGGGSGLSGCGASSDWVWDAQTWVAQGIWWAVLIPAASLIAYGSHLSKHPRPPRQVRPPKGRLRVEATAQPPLSPVPPAAQPPLCLHLNAVPVDLSARERVAWLCPECGEGLPEEFGRLRRPCCGTLHGGQHFAVCPHFGEERRWR